MKSLYQFGIGVQAWLYQRTGGKFGGDFRGFKVLLLTTVGRKSGKKHTTPLGWFEHAEGYVIVASNAGKPSNPSWFYNLKENPQVTIQVMDKVMPSTAEILSGDTRTEAWRKVIATAPIYGNYKKVTTREIPLILLRPNK
jgi:deazaflavin-dependent oxidoreductase (nitroreductase family)